MLGHQDVKFERALQCVENVYHSTARPPASNNAACPSPAAAVRQEDDLDSTTVTCSCYDSLNASYDIYIHISTQTKGVKEATCSCPYMKKSAKKGDICKHIIAALLKYCCTESWNNDPKAGTKVLPKNKQSAVSTSPSLSPRKRQLPSWMKQSVNTDLTKCSNVNQWNTSLCDAKRSKSSKQGSLVRRTIYCMTPEEFRKTALEILQENRSSEKYISVVDDQLEKKQLPTSGSNDQEKANTISQSEMSQDQSQLHTLMLGKIDAAFQEDYLKRRQPSKCTLPSTVVAAAESLGTTEDVAMASQDLFDWSVNTDYNISKDDPSILDDLL